MSLAIIERQANGLTVGQRESDGYVNATKLCQAAGKLLADYLRLKSTKEYLKALSVDMGIPISKLVDRDNYKSKPPSTVTGKRRL